MLRSAINKPGRTSSCSSESNEDEDSGVSGEQERLALEDCDILVDDCDLSW